MATPTSPKHVDKRPALQPVIFRVPGVKPDVLFKVFEVEFHVHSLILKIYSAFFRKFLDSPDKVTSPSSAFKYEWVSQVDDDGSWSLVAAPADRGDVLNIVGELFTEKHAFHNLLCAMYNQPYTVYFAEELYRMTQMADYYCALPILSRTLDGALYRSPGLIADIFDEAVRLFSTAAKLRNALLFRECLIFVVGPWKAPQFESFELSDDLKKLAQNVYNAQCADIVRSQSKLLDTIQSADRHLNESTREAFMVAPTIFTPNGEPEPVSLPAYYRSLAEKEPFLFRDALRNILWSNLLLHKPLQLDELAGVGFYREWFLCAHINDEDLPWDTTETDW